MKFVEKKCPNCGANIKFKVGERDVHCEKCRRDFAVEYDTDPELSDAAAEIRAESIRLASDMLSHANRNMKLFRIIFFTIFGICIVSFLVIFVMGMINAAQSRKEYNEQWQKANNNSYITP